MKKYYFIPIYNFHFTLDNIPLNEILMDNHLDLFIEESDLRISESFMEDYNYTEEHINRMRTQLFEKYEKKGVPNCIIIEKENNEYRELHTRKKLGGKLELIDDFEITEEQLNMILSRLNPYKEYIERLFYNKKAKIIDFNTEKNKRR